MNASTSNHQSPGPVRLTHIEGLRAAAALVVYLNHAYAQAWNPMRDQFPQGALSLFSYSLIAGHFAVSVFIAISGFCLALPVIAAADQVPGGFKAFLKRRAWRILPPYYAALCLSLLLIWTAIGEPTGSLWDVPIQVDAQAIASHVLLLQDFFRTGRINYVFWSIAVEWHIYFLFPLLVLAIRRRGLAQVVVAGLLGSLLIALLGSETRWERANPHYLGIFTLGILAAYLSRQAVRLPRWATIGRLWSGMAVGLFVGLCAALAQLGFDLSYRQTVTMDLLVGLFACSLLVGTSLSDESWLRRIFEWRPLVLVGTFSYSLYLVHAPLLQLIWQYLLLPFEPSHDTTFYVLMTGGLALTLLGAYGFFLLCERPFLRRKAPRIARSDARTLRSALS